MKKFLTMLLALSVVFTYTFGAAGSVFAKAGTKYGVDESKALLAAAYTAAVADATAYDKNYDSEDYGAATPETDITVFEVSKEAVIAGIDGAYADALSIIVGSSASLESTVSGLVGDYDSTKNNVSSSADVIKVKNYLLDAAKDSDAVLKAAFADYKAFLTKIVEGVDVSVYTTTVQDTPYEAADGETYNISAKAAAADVAYAKALISKAKYGSTSSPSAETEWTASYVELYSAVFGDDKVVKISRNWDDPINTSLVTSLTYKLVAKDRNDDRAYATTKSEANDAANNEVTRAAAKAALLAAVTTYENENTLKADAQAQLDAFKEAKTYLIENADMGSFATTYSIYKVTAAGVDVTDNSDDTDAVDYVALKDAAAVAVKAVPTMKETAIAYGYNWDDAEAAKALKVQLLSIYGETANATFNDTNVISSDLTASQKAAYKIDYSDIEADTAVGYHGYVYSYDGEAYYEAEWADVKAAIDAYNAAVDAAKVDDDVTDAATVLGKTIDKITTADDLYDAVDEATATIASLEQYAGLAYDNAHAADSTVTAIYVTFGETTDKVDANPASLTDEAIFLWAIDNSAKTAKDVAAKYADACKVIDASKTLATLKSEATAVVAQIAALPATPAVADKAAVVAAYDAYAALDDDAQNYVTNYPTLVAAVKAVEKAKAYEVKAIITALPAAEKVVAADKAAVVAASDAYDAYRYTTAYAIVSPKTLVNPGYNFNTALNNAKADAANTLVTTYNALNNKYVANKLSAEDAAAVKELQDILAAYIAEYKAVPMTTAVPPVALVDEVQVGKIAAIVAAAVEAAEEAAKWTDKDVKAAMYDVAKTTSYTKPTAKSVKLTAKADVTEIVENGYTIKYRFYQKGPKKTSYKLWKTTTSNSYTFKGLKKGTHYFKVKISVYDAEGKLVAYL